MTGRMALAILLATGALTISGCSRDPIVADVHGRKISSEEFRDRYNKYLTEIQRRDNILLREQILNNMINEILIMEDIERLGIAHDGMSERKIADLRTQALLDGYARRVSLDTMTVLEPELWKEFHSYNTRASARYLYARTEDEARELKRKLENGATFEQLAQEVFEDPGLATNGGYLGSFGWGEMEPALEDVAFFGRIGELTDPIKLKVGYAIVKVESRVEIPLASEYDYAIAKEKLERAIREKKTVNLVKGAASAAGSELDPRFREDAVQFLYRNWSTLGQQETGAKETGSLPAAWADTAEMELVKFKGARWTISDFLSRLEKTSKGQRNRVRSERDVKDVAIGLATREVLVRKALELGVDVDGWVTSQIQRASQEYLLRRWASAVQDTVGENGWDDGDLYKHFESKRAEYAFPPEVNVAEILVRTEPEASAIMTRLKQGESFADLARNSIRLWAAKRSGELGFGTRARFGPMADKFFSARVGDIVGPENVDPYFGIFKILDRREGRQQSFEEAREQIIRELSFVRKREVFRRAVDDLRKNASFTIDMDVLANVELHPPS